MQKSRFHSTPNLLPLTPGAAKQTPERAKLGCSEVQVGSQNECSEIAEKNSSRRSRPGCVLRTYRSKGPRWSPKWVGLSRQFPGHVYDKRLLQLVLCRLLHCRVETVEEKECHGRRCISRRSH